VTDSVIRANQADWGGAIHNYEGNLTVTDSTISDNFVRLSVPSWTFASWTDPLSLGILLA
jgi:hypothetical protein